MCVDVDGGKGVSGAKIVTNPCTGALQQQWVWDAQGYLRWLPNSTFCIDVHDAVSAVLGAIIICALFACGVGSAMHMPWHMLLISLPISMLSPQSPCSVHSRIQSAALDLRPRARWLLYALLYTLL
jgi:hypothetical protein